MDIVYMQVIAIAQKDALRSLCHLSTYRGQQTINHPVSDVVQGFQERLHVRLHDHASLLVTQVLNLWKQLE